jgi:hypothetical protein
MRTLFQGAHQKVSIFAEPCPVGVRSVDGGYVSNEQERSS